MDTLDPLSTLGGPVAGLANAAGNNVYSNSQVWVRRDPTNQFQYNFGVLERGVLETVGGAVTWSTQSFAVGSTHLVVFGLQMISGANNDIASLWIDPDASSFGAVNAPTATITSSSGIDATQVNRFRLLQNSNGQAGIYGKTGGTAGLQSVDELRIGTTWADVVVAVPEPSTYALLTGIMAALVIARRRRN